MKRNSLILNLIALKKAKIVYIRFNCGNVSLVGWLVTLGLFSLYRAASERDGERRACLHNKKTIQRCIDNIRVAGKRFRNIYSFQFFGVILASEG